MKKINVKILKEQVRVTSDSTDSADDKSPERETDIIPAELQAGYNYVLENITRTAAEHARGKGVAQQVANQLKQLRDNPDVDLSNIESIIKQNEERLKGEDAEDLKSTGQTVKTGYETTTVSDEGETSCMDAYGNNATMTTSLVLIGGVAAPFLYHNFLSPAAANRMNATSKGITYLMRNIVNSVMTVGWEKTPIAQQEFKKFLKNRVKMADIITGKMKQGQLIAAGAGIFALAAAAAWIAFDAGDIDEEEATSQARENAQRIAELIAQKKYTELHKNVFRYIQKIDPQSDFLWNDPCALTALIGSTAAGFAAVKGFRMIKPGAAGQVKNTIRQVAIVAARETQSLAEAMIKFGDDFFDSQNLEKIFASIPNNRLFGAEAFRGVGQLGSGLLDVDNFKAINKAAKEALTGTAQQQQAAREALGKILDNLSDGARGEALAYLDELEQAFSAGQRTVLKTHVGVASRGNVLINKLLSIGGAGLGHLFKYPYTWLTSGSAPKYGEEAIRLLDDVPHFNYVDEFAEQGVRGELARSVDEMGDALKLADDQVLTMFYGLPFRSPRAASQGFDEVLDTINVVKKQIGDRLEGLFTREAEQAIRTAMVESRRKLAREVGSEADEAIGYSKLADDLEAGAPIALSGGTKQAIKQLSDDLVDITVNAVNSKRFQNAIVAAWKEFLSKIRSLKPGDRKAISTELKNASLKIDDELDSIIRRRDIAGGSMPRDVDFEIPELVALGGKSNLTVTDVATRRSLQDVLSSLTGRKYQLTERGTSSVSRISRDLSEKLRKESIRRKKANPTNLTNLGPNAEIAAITAFVVGGVGIVMFQAAQMLKAQTETRVIGQGDNTIRQEVINKIPEGEGNFVQRGVVNWYSKTFVGRKAEADYINAHDTILEDGSISQNKELIQSNLKGIFFARPGLLDRTIVSDAAKKDQKKDNLYKLLLDIKEGKYDSSDKSVYKIIDRFCTIRRPQIERAARAIGVSGQARVKGGEVTISSQDEESEKETNQNIDLLSQIVAVTYIQNNPQFEQQIRELVATDQSDQELEDIGDSFEYQPEMVDSIGNFINEYGKTNIQLYSSGTNVQVTRSKKEGKLSKLRIEKERLEAKLRAMAQGGEETPEAIFNMKNISRDIEEIEDAIERIKNESVKNNKTVIYGRDTLSKLVYDCLKEYKGYSPYPYHSDIGISDEPADDYMQDWKDFELSLVRDETRDTAINLAKILVKDLELFGDVVDLVGQNQSIGTEILKKIKKKQTKKS